MRLNQTKPNKRITFRQNYTTKTAEKMDLVFSKMYENDENNLRVL